MQHLIEPAVRTLVSRIVQGRYPEAIEFCSVSRASASDLERVVNEYPYTFILPPPAAYDELDILRIDDLERARWSVRVPMWTREEGRSDLELQLTVVIEDGRVGIELDDFLVP